MSEPVYHVQFPEGQQPDPQTQKTFNAREVVAVVILIIGVTAMSIGVGGFLDSLWAGVAVAGTVLTVLGVLLGNN